MEQNKEFKIEVLRAYNRIIVNLNRVTMNAYLYQDIDIEINKLKELALRGPKVYQEIETEISIDSFLTKGTKIVLGEGIGIVSEDKGDRVYFCWLLSGCYSFVWKCNILKAYKVGKVDPQNIIYE